jgi:hypothetical protein
MLVVFTVIGGLVLALLVSVAWPLGRVWWRTRGVQAVTCPGSGNPSLLRIDPWHAVGTHARGDAELRVLECFYWPERGDCARQCLSQFPTAR